MIILKSFRSIGEKSEKIDKSPIISNHDFDKKGLLKIYLLLYFSIYQFENDRVSLQGHFYVKYRTHF